MPWTPFTERMDTIPVKIGEHEVELHARVQAAERSSVEIVGGHAAVVFLAASKWLEQNRNARPVLLECRYHGRYDYLADQMFRLTMHVARVDPEDQEELNES